MVVTDDIETICINPKLIDGKLIRGTTIEEVIYKGETVWFDTKRNISIYLDLHTLGIAFRKMLTIGANMSVNNVPITGSELSGSFHYSEIILKLEPKNSQLSSVINKLRYEVKGDDGTLLFKTNINISTPPYVQKIPTYIFEGKNVKFFDKINIEFYS